MANSKSMDANDTLQRAIDRAPSQDERERLEAVREYLNRLIDIEHGGAHLPTEREPIMIDDTKPLDLDSTSWFTLLDDLECDLEAVITPRKFDTVVALYFGYSNPVAVHFDKDDAVTFDGRWVREDYKPFVESVARLALRDLTVEVG